jgi:pectate lyase
MRKTTLPEVLPNLKECPGFAILIADAGGFYRYGWGQAHHERSTELLCEGITMNTRSLSIGLLLSAIALQAQTVTIKESAGWFETAFVEWQTTGSADRYNAYVNGEGLVDQKLDDQLIRNYGAYWRADAIGLKAGSYTLKVAPVVSGNEGTAAITGALTVTAYDRTGFAFSGGNVPSAYNLDGTPMTGAVVIYLTEKTKDVISMTVTGANANPCVGIQTILDGFAKGKDSRPLIVRVVGQVSDPTYTQDGDILLANKNLATGHMTFEGVGDDATANGWGVRIKDATSLEVRNLGVMNVNSTAGDDIGLQQSNDHIWIHNNDHFYGDAGPDADQIKGDGAMDVKLSTYVTIAYDHFWDNGKTSLLGLSENTTAGLYISYHHNWFDHCDSRHPRVRFYSAHVYNNYYDGIAKYGAGATMGSSIFMEANYIRNCKYPMLTSLQGSDIWDESTSADNASLGTFSGEDGGAIKAWNNHMEGQKRFVAYGAAGFPNSTVDFDAYVAASRTETVPATVKSAAGANIYNNFDTDASVMYAYTPDAPDAAKTRAMTYAGRVQGGDFKWTFNNAIDDTSSAVNAPLKAAIVGYKTSLVYIQGEGTPPTATTRLPQTGTAPNPIRINLRSRRLSMADGRSMQSAEFFAIGGALILQAAMRAEVSFAGLGRGVYLARIRTDRGVFENIVRKND